MLLAAIDITRVHSRSLHIVQEANLQIMVFLFSQATKNSYTLYT